MRDSFSSYHPIINFYYFALMIITGAVFLHPAILCVSIAGGFVYSLLLNGGGALKFNLFFLLPVMLMAAVANPLFNHAGVTTLGYIGDNPFTLESLYYGIASALMIASVILWCSCYNAVMTSDKFIYIFGRVIPSISLIFSMALRFIPRFKAQILEVSFAQRCVGRSVTSGNVLKRAKNGMKILSIMLTWSLENAVDTADSMKARGYGLPGRGSFSLFRFDARDALSLVALLIFTACIATGAALGEFSAQFFPSIKMKAVGGPGLAIYAFYAALSFMPVILNIREKILWRGLERRE